MVALSGCGNANPLPRPSETSKPAAVSSKKKDEKQDEKINSSLRIIYKTDDHTVRAADKTGKDIEGFTPIKNVELFRASPQFIAFTHDGNNGTKQGKFQLAEKNGKLSHPPVQPSDIVDLNVSDSYLTFVLKPNEKKRSIHAYALPLSTVSLGKTTGYAPRFSNNLLGRLTKRRRLTILQLFNLKAPPSRKLMEVDSFQEIQDVKKFEMNQRRIVYQDVNLNELKITDLRGEPVSPLTPILNVDQFEVSEDYIAYTSNGSSVLNLADLDGTQVPHFAPIAKVKSFRISNAHLVYISTTGELHLVDLTGTPVEEFSPIPKVSEAYLFE
jgi:hypothetical protein